MESRPMLTRRWLWIGGWGVAPEWFGALARAAYPSFDHVVVPPAPGPIAAVDWPACERIGGYSLGALLLLKNAALVPSPALLLAPFFAYPAEAGLGGKIRQAQIRYLARWLRREPSAALADFHHRAGLASAPSDRLPYPLEDLLWGLTQLADVRLSPQLPAGWNGFIGDRDPLLDGHVLAAAAPGLTIVTGAGHHPEALLQAALERTP
jgi:hypothetical protein